MINTDDTRENTEKPGESDFEQFNDQDFEDLPPLEDVDENAKPIKPKGFKLEKDKEEVVDDDGYLDVLDNKEILKKVRKEGNKELGRPQRGCKVLINLSLKLKGNPTPVETESFTNLEIFVGDYDVIHGVDMAIPLMDIGEIAEVLIAPRFGYGSEGNKDVPSDSHLECLIELLSTEYVDEESSLPLSSRIKYGGRKKERGNFWYTRKDYSIAGQCYKRALTFLDANDSELNDEEEQKPDTKDMFEKLLSLRTATFSNLAAVQMKNEAYEGALKSINSALMHDEKNVKALFRKGKILDCLGEFTEALEAFNGAYRLSPEDKVIRQEISKLTIKRKQQLAKEKSMYKKMLQINDDDDDGKPNANPLKRSLLKWGMLATTLSTVVISFFAYKAYQ